MNSLSHFLDRFKAILLAPGALKKPIIEVISRCARIDLKETDIEVKEGIIYIKAHPLIKNEIFMRKGRILHEVEVLLGKKSLHDIR